jgi:hypothetical protein
MITRFTLYRGDGAIQHLELKGRVADTLCKLIDAGRDGLTSLENPAPRWSDYIFKLRRRGVEIETLNEEHGGDFPGHHGRYILRSKVERLFDLQVAA